MGCACSCLHEDYSEEQEHRSVNCIDYLAWLVDHVFQSMFPRRERVVPSDEQDATLSEQVNNRADDAGFTPSRPLSNNDPRSSHPQTSPDKLVDDRLGRLLGHVKGCGVHLEKSLSIRSENVTGTNSTCRKDNLDGSKNGRSKMCYSESSLKQPPAEMRDGRTTYLYAASEDEDVCSICLEEYTYENPRITLKCTHQFHLSCIYAWMERSHSCPFCSKLMLFTEES